MGLLDTAINTKKILVKYILKLLVTSFITLAPQAHAAFCNEVDVFPWFTPVEGTYDNKIGDHRFYEIRADIQNIDKGKDKDGKPNSPTSIVQFTYIGAYASEAISNGSAVYTLEPSAKAQIKSEVIARFEGPLTSNMAKDIRKELNGSSKKDNISAAVCINSEVNHAIVLKVPGEGDFHIAESKDLANWRNNLNLGTLWEGQVLVINWTRFWDNFQNAFPDLKRSFFRLNANFIDPEFSSLDLDMLILQGKQNGISGEVIQIP